MVRTYTKNRLYEIAEENYLALIKFCDILESEGYWQQPETVLKKSIYEWLDLYIQAVLVQFAVFCKQTGIEQRKFIYALSRFHMFQVNEKQEFTYELCEETRKTVSVPPVFLQLCGLRDLTKQSSMAGLFFDAVINIILAQSYVEQSVSEVVAKYITELYKRVSVFLYNGEQTAGNVDETYIFYKISNFNLEGSGRAILEAGEDFVTYKKNTLRIRNVEKSSNPEKNIRFDSSEEEQSFRSYMKNKLKENNNSSLKTEAPNERNILQDTEDEYRKYIGSYEEFEKDKEQASLTNEALEEVVASNDIVKEIKKKMRLDELLEELDALVGLIGVKKEINSLINLIKVKKMRESHSLPSMDMSYHMVFTGSPGTGKTTVARLVAEIYKEIGLLSQGNLIETDRAGLVAGFVGQTALKVSEVVEKAVGGVLFIDEAYTLSSAIGSNDFGGEAIDTLVKLMEDHRDDLVVIVAGYTYEMEQFLKANTGLVSRFNKFIEFRNYTEDELIKILCSMSEKSGFAIREEALAIIRRYLETRSKDEIRTFGNARGIRNMFEKIVVNQANRVVECVNPTVEQLTIIETEDVEQWNDTEDGGVVC